MGYKVEFCEDGPKVLSRARRLERGPKVLARAKKLEFKITWITKD